MVLTRRTTISLVLVIVIASSLALFASLQHAPPSQTTSPRRGTLRAAYVQLQAYSGWKGVESMITPLDEYVKIVTGSNIYYGDFYWPLADSKRPFQEILERGSSAVMVTILSIERVYRHGFYAYLTYKAKIDKVIVKPQNTVETPPQAVCAKNPASCDRAKKQYDTIS
ncbi:MAG: hypothetical protein F7C33_03520, partial [Desulfurococcales archaeon]|nr:hypothetical protein [Desulfurococcales archaeon]